MEKNLYKIVGIKEQPPELEGFPVRVVFCVYANIQDDKSPL